MDTINSASYIDVDKLSHYAASNAKLLRPKGEYRLRSAAKDMSAAYRELKRFHSEIERRYATLPSPPESCQWMLDNWYMIEREYRASIGQFNRAGKLRRCGRESMLFRLCRMLVISGQGKVTEERFRVYMDGFQSVTVLKRAELRLMRPALGAAVTEEIRKLCREMRSRADTDSFAPLFEALFSTLRLFSVLDMEKLIRAVDVTDTTLCDDPTGVYKRMDSGTKAAYLDKIELLSARQGLEEHIYAAKLIKRAQTEKKHPGFFLFPEKGEATGNIYITANVLLTVFFTLLAAFSCQSAAAGFLLFLPMWELVKASMDYVLLHLVKPRRLFRMDTEQGLGEEGRCLCVISMLLGDGSGAERLEELYHACKSEKELLYFALLADLPEGSAEREEGDEALIAPLREAVHALNLKYGARFFLFTRERSFDGRRYSARERKRGALMELAKLLCDRESSLEVTGEKDALSGVKLILTLDSDTRIYPGSAGQLIAAMLHPLNRPVIDPRDRIVRSGHAIIHPRIDIELKSAGETDFALIFSGGGGSDPYGGLCGELYMDAFDCGGFAGKGLIDARALLECTEAFPEGVILSHDAPEGAFLRGAYMSDTEFSDRFPSKPLAYYKRQHRWTRGDWQNLRFLTERRLRSIDRWRLFDALRRSLNAPATLLALLAGFFAPESAMAVAAWAALLAVLSRLVISFAELAVKDRGTLHLRRHTRIFSGVGGAMIQSFIRLWLLPYEAWISLSAIATALWRMAVSRKNLLQWQTAAQSEVGKGLEGHIRAMWFPMALGLVLVLMCSTVIGKSAGLMWLLSPAAAAALALPASREQKLSGSDRDYLFEAARASYSYFETFSGARDNFLPPDNFQEQPPVGPARRTSPTNMGLALCSHLAAFQLGFISKTKLTDRISAMLDTFERMDRCMGHYYNWYDTTTLRPLLPAFVSTVDSGNLYAALTVLYRGMIELGQGAICLRIKAILDKMDFAPLYDSVRGLFHICYDSAEKKGTGGWYDLMASEAMLTSYVAVAKGDVPIKHWRALSRAQLQKDGYRGLASWTGTMFEYLMPELFMPLYRGSLLYESARFCIYAQKRRVWAGKPWGISESAFYSLDSALNYRYKAHGCAALALKRGQDAELVVSPYSSFLALAVDPQGSVRNLRHLESFGAKGRFGFIEALDFSPGRCRSDRGEQVRCYMAHHLGMSLISAANTLKDGCMQRLFMAQPEMNAFSLLLQERLDEGAVLIRREVGAVPERTERLIPLSWQLRGGSEDTGEHCCVLSNGAYSLICDNRGKSRASCAPVSIYSDGWEAYDSPGMGFSLCCDGECRQLLPCTTPDMWELSEDTAALKTSVDDVECKISASAAYGDCGELRSVTLKSAKDRRATLIMEFRPILAPEEDYFSHCAFWALGMEATEEKGILLLHRLPRGRCGELWLAAACSEKAVFSADRKGGIGALSEPLVRISAELSLQQGEKHNVRFALCLAMDKDEAAQGAERILRSEAADKGNMAGAAALHLKMNGGELGAAMELLGHIRRGTLHEAAPKKDLWPYAISGDLPIICCPLKNAEAEALLRRFCLLKSCGVSADLVYLSDEHGEYRQPMYRRITELLDSFGLGALCSSPGGVHFAPVSASGTIMSRALWYPGMVEKSLPAPPEAENSRPRQAGSVPEHRWQDEKFDFYVHDSLPGRPWQLMLTNGHFGCIAMDCGMGPMWYENAREMPVSLPPCNLLSTKLNEELWLDKNGERISLFAANDAFPCRLSFAPGLARWEKEFYGREIRLSAFVPVGINARVIIIEGALGLKLGWTLRPVLGSSDAASLSLSVDKGLFRAENPESYLPGAVFYALCSNLADGGCLYAPPAMHCSFIADDTAVIVCGFGSEEDIRALARVDAAFAAMDETKRHWKALTGRMSLESGEKALDDYISHWCAYQSIACRLEGRSSLYQSGGAIGFRDQLQDGVNLILLSPEYAKDRIVDACRHQFVEGDVLHWWHPHPEGDKGVRTRCSDDLLWLVWAVCEYCEKTGDRDICAIPLPYIQAPALEEGQRDSYICPTLSEKSESILEHARAALEQSVSRGFGRHGIPFMGSGDWNDGLDRVEGESVWLGWFMAHCARRFAALLERLGMAGGDKYSKLAKKLMKAAEGTWTGRWYTRAYFADGNALGGSDRIDSIAQSWAVLADTDSVSARAKSAVAAATERLIDRKTGIVKLFDPPFSADETPSPGYIASYGEGFRENGGQYTHAAIWLAIACFELDHVDEGWEILSMLLPANRELGRYAAEPYVLAADIYSAKGREGEAGWSWYTGSAGWYFRAVYEHMLGLRLINGKLSIAPKLPSAIEKCRVFWTDNTGKKHEIDISRKGILVDGENYSGGEIG